MGSSDDDLIDYIGGLLDEEPAAPSCPEPASAPSAAEASSAAVADHALSPAGDGLVGDGLVASDDHRAASADVEQASVADADDTVAGSAFKSRVEDEGATAVDVIAELPDAAIEPASSNELPRLPALAESPALADAPQEPSGATAAEAAHEASSLSEQGSVAAAETAENDAAAEPPPRLISLAEVLGGSVSRSKPEAAEPDLAGDAALASAAEDEVREAASDVAEFASVGAAESLDVKSADTDLPQAFEPALDEAPAASEPCLADTDSAAEPAPVAASGTSLEESDSPSESNPTSVAVSEAESLVDDAVDDEAPEQPMATLVDTGEAAQEAEAIESAAEALASEDDSIEAVPSAGPVARQPFPDDDVEWEAPNEFNVIDLDADRSVVSHEIVASSDSTEALTARLSAEVEALREAMLARRRGLAPRAEAYASAPESESVFVDPAPADATASPSEPFAAADDDEAHLTGTFGELAGHSASEGTEVVETADEAVAATDTAALLPCDEHSVAEVAEAPEVAEVAESEPSQTAAEDVAAVASEDHALADLESQGPVEPVEQAEQAEPVATPCAEIEHDAAAPSLPSAPEEAADSATAESFDVTGPLHMVMALDGFAGWGGQPLAAMDTAPAERAQPFEPETRDAVDLPSTETGALADAAVDSETDAVVDVDAAPVEAHDVVPGPSAEDEAEADDELHASLALPDDIADAVTEAAAEETALAAVVSDAAASGSVPSGDAPAAVAEPPLTPATEPPPEPLPELPAAVWEERLVAVAVLSFGADRVMVPRAALGPVLGLTELRAPQPGAASLFAECELEDGRTVRVCAAESVLKPNAEPSPDPLVAPDSRQVVCLGTSGWAVACRDIEYRDAVPRSSIRWRKTRGRHATVAGLEPTERLPVLDIPTLTARLPTD